MNKAMLLKQYMFNNKKKSRLPSAYQEVEYIESTGTQYIDTNIKVSDLSSAISMSYRFMPTNTLSTNESAYLGTYGTYPNYFMQLTTRSNISNVDLFIGNPEQGGEAHFTRENWTNYEQTLQINITGSSGSAILNSNTQSFNYTAPTISGALYLFALNNNGTPKINSAMRLYEFKFKNNGTLIRNFIPCYRKSDNEVGLYDIVNNQFYTNQGTGSFLCGRPLVYDTISGYQQIDYIESTGTQAITIDFVENPLIVPLYVESDEAKIIFTGTDWELSDWVHGGSNYCPFKVVASKIVIKYTSYVDTTVNNLSLNTRYVFNTYFSNGKQVVKKDGEEVVNLTQTGELSFKRLNIFAYNESQSIGDFSIMKLYSFKLYKDDGYIFNLIPMRRKLDGELGLYDLVNNQFHTNSGSGTFIAGEVLKA